MSFSASGGSVNADGVTIEQNNSGQIQVKDSGVSRAKLAADALGEWILIEKKTIAAGSSTNNVTFNTDIGSHKLYKLVFDLIPDHTTNGADYIGLQFNGDTAAHYEYRYVNNVTNGSAADPFIAIGAMNYASGAVYPTAGEILIPNKKAGETNMLLSGNSFGHVGAYFGFLSGIWNTPAALTAIKAYSNGGRAFKGTISLYYNYNAD